jgi:uncharacterized protein YoxC
MDINNIFNILLLASGSALCIALIFYFNRITQSIAKIEIDIRELTRQIDPLITSTTLLSEKISAMSDSAKKPILLINEVVEEIKDRIDVILEFEEKLRNGVEGPLSKLLNSISGISNAVNTFWTTYKRR